MSDTVQSALVALLVVGAAVASLLRLRRQGAGSSSCSKCSGCGSEDPACVRELTAKLRSNAPPPSEQHP
jgi:hypothetical protein